MRPLSQCIQRCALCSAIALSLATLPMPAHAGTLTGPGNTFTVTPGYPTEVWDVSDGAELIIAPGGSTSGVQVDNARLTGTDVVMSGVSGLRLANNSTGAITGGQIIDAGIGSDAITVDSGSSLSLDDLSITSTRHGFNATGTGSTLSVSNTVVTSANDTFRVGDNGTLVLDNVQAATTSTFGGHYALWMIGGNAQVSGSTLSSTFGGVRLSAGTLTLDDSDVRGDDTALALAGSPSGIDRPTAAVSNSTLTGAVGALVATSSLSLTGSTVRGTGGGTTTGDGTGVRVTNSTLQLTQDSRVEGTIAGMVLSSIGGGNNTVLIDASVVSASVGPSVNMLGGNADVTLTNGAQLVAGNGVAIQVAETSSLNLTISDTSITGDLVGATSATTTLNVTLGSGAWLQGAIINGTDVQLDAAQWQLTADSNVQQLELGSGARVLFGDGNDFHTLQVAGNYTGNGGTLLFNAVLAGDDAPTDRLVIGGDSSGQTNVQVNNIGGPGAPTNRGIQLIAVAGASNGSFDLVGRAVGGQYEYFLFKEAADGGWYLRSELPDPCDIDPSLPECQNPEPEPVPEPVPVLRPEPGAYLANHQAADGMFRLGYHHRQAGQNSGRAWARVDGSRSGFGANLQQLNVHGSSQALSVGAQVFGSENGSGVGVMVGSGNASSTSTSELTGYYARGKVKGNAVGVYGTWRTAAGADPYAGLYVDGSVQRVMFRNEVEGAALATERYDSRAWQSAVEVGYAFAISRGPNSSVFVEPQLQVGYSRWDSLQHTERNGTVVRAEDASGAFGRAGVRISGVTRWGGSAAEVQPYVAASWLRNASNPYVRMDDEAVDARIPRQRGEFSAGASVRFPGGFGAWAGLTLQRGSGYHQRSAQLGLSYRW
ncbi:autotransporter outer membrane beta-barrel domain-containing protein [Stenotrophomonas sp. PS02289]|uniref:autotransporter family protein n=1 Tax=Stenotrophomonas sp. PS02289 TaxID=2991422 RepID=UPI00249B524C|nr:autotransporter outer membrane beta-barrel domain-containing protein [Stenotrophomonas sp. PS02289]